MTLPSTTDTTPHAVRTPEAAGFDTRAVRAVDVLRAGPAKQLGGGAGFGAQLGRSGGAVHGHRSATAADPSAGPRTPSTVLDMTPPRTTPSFLLTASSR